MGENIIGDMLAGLVNSLSVSVIGIALGIGIGAIVGALRHAAIPVVDQLAAAYVNAFRCTPLLVQIFMLFYALPDIGIRLSAFETSWLALGLWGGAYHVETFRAAFGAVAPNDVLAARALGMPSVQAFRYVTLPLGLRLALPAATTTAITQFRSSSFMVVVGYQELTYVANRLVSETFQVFRIFGIAALMYLVISLLIAAGSRWAEAGLARRGFSVAR